ncbi:MAG: ABC transporter ATP-binding protein [Geminicoccaceae bacterium]
MTKSFRKDQVLNGVSLEIERGETVVVFGASGSGKTVLLRLIAGMYEPDEGDIRIGDESVVGVGPEARDVGMAFQNFALYPHLPAFENIASPLRARKTPEPEIRRRVVTIAELLRIDHVLDHLPRALSNGQKQRTALARSLVSGPSVLLLDDPLRNVDAKLRYEMRLELPRVLHEFEATVIYVTQDYKEAMALGDRVAVLMGGRFAQAAPPSAIYREPANTGIARLFGDPAINLHPCRPDTSDGEVGVELFGSRFALPPAYAEAAGRECLIGLRPEHLSVGMEQTEGAVPVELDAVTPLNVRAVLLLKTRDGEEILASCTEDEALRFPRGHRAVWARPAMDTALLFDRESGQRIGPGLH